jgi:hypothetical protein
VRVASDTSLNQQPSLIARMMFVSRFPGLLVILLLIHTGLLVYAASRNGPGFDEIGHLPAGICYWRSGNTSLYRVNPPLARAMACLTLGCLAVDVADTDVPEGSLVRTEFDVGENFWSTHGSNAYWYLTLARWTSIPWSLMAAVVIFLWSRDLYGPEAGLISAMLWCFCPFVLTNAQLITPDTCAAATGVLTAYSFWHWTQRSTVRRTYEFGVTLGIAMLSKFVWIFLPLLFVTLWCVLLPLKGRVIGSRETLTQGFLLIASLVCALLVVNVGYGFVGSFRQLNSYRFVSEQLRQPALLGKSGNCFSDSVIGKLPVPLPSDFVLGVDRQRLDFEIKWPSYLRGEWREHGWWYYYLYGLMVKLPIAYLVIGGLAIGQLVYISRKQVADMLTLLSPSVALFVFVSSHTGFNHHVRYVLPALPMIYVWVGGVWKPMSRLKGGAVVITALFLSGVVSVLSMYPHHHAYFNVIGGGAKQGHLHLLNSNLDWGQGILELARWSKGNPNNRLDGVACCSQRLIRMSDIGLPDSEVPKGFSDLVTLSKEQLRRRREEGRGPKAGRYAIFVNELYGHDGAYKYFLKLEPIAVVAYTVFVFEVTEADVNDYWASVFGEVGDE